MILKYIKSFVFYLQLTDSLYSIKNLYQSPQQNHLKNLNNFSYFFGTPFFLGLYLFGKALKARISVTVMKLAYLPEF